MHIYDISSFTQILNLLRNTNSLVWWRQKTFDAYSAFTCTSHFQIPPASVKI